MYYWGVNSKMQTSHTLCSRPNRYGALQKNFWRPSHPPLVVQVTVVLAARGRVVTVRRLGVRPGGPGPPGALRLELAPVVATAFFPLINLPNFILASLYESHLS